MNRTRLAVAVCTACILLAGAWWVHRLNGRGARSRSHAAGSAKAAGPSARADAAEARLEDLRAAVARLANRPAEGHSREEMLADLESLKAEAERLKPAVRDKPGWAAVPEMLKEAETRFGALRSEKPDPAIFQPLPPAPEWRVPPGTAGLAAEVSFHHYKFRPPTGALLDLRSSEDDANGLVWREGGAGGAEMSVKLQPRRNPTQLRPWVVGESFMLKDAEAQNLLAVYAPGAATQVGRADGLTFTRIAPDPSKMPASQPAASKASGWWVKYIALDGNNWLVIDIRAPAANSTAAARFESSVKTIRKTPPDEPRSEPFAPELLAPRLADDPERARNLLRRLGSAADTAVAAQLASPDPRVRHEAARLIGEIATAASIPALRQAANSPDPEVAAAARAVLARLDTGGSTVQPKP